MEGLDSFAPDVDIQAEIQKMDDAPKPEPTPDPEPTPEPEPVAKEPEPEHKPEKTVPLAALHESRLKEREWREKAANIEKESQERFAKLEQRLEKLANPPPPVPDFNENPAEHLRYQVETQQAELAALRQAGEQSKSQQEAQELERQIATNTVAAEQAFAKEHPDYSAAVAHLQAVANKNLEMMGMDDPVARQNQIRQDALAMAFKAFQLGKSPAEVAYNLAQNYGYNPNKPAPQAEPSKKIAALQEGQKTVGMPEGGTKHQPITLATLEAMDDEDFDKLIADDASWRKLVKSMG